MLSVRVDRPAEDLVVIAVTGEIDSVTAPKLSTSLHRELERQPAALILDLTAVSFLGVAGLHVLNCVLDRSKTLSIALSVVHHEQSSVQSALRAAANIRRGHYELGTELTVNLRVPAAFDELVMAI
ncbi:MAG: STAS domain-containing protein [Actinomycetota bacterium]|nr:STAS domain-containing protein [Actinomycetota bacterium]